MRRLILPLVLMVVACQPATMELTEEQKAEIAAEVNALQADLWDAWREMDIDRALSFGRDVPEFMFAYEGQLWDYAEFEEAARSVSADVESQTFTITESQTTVLAPDVVCITEQGTNVATDTMGETGPEVAFAITVIWVHRDGEWKIEHNHESHPTPEVP